MFESEERIMATTRIIPRREWQAYFDRYTREHLDPAGEDHETAVLEILSPELGDQVEVAWVPLLGLTYDPKSNAFELAMEEVDHLVFRPEEIAVVEEEDGFISALEVSSDDAREIIRLRRGGQPATLHEPAPEPRPE
jgi:Family of unknown function (DUF5335)